MELRIHKLMWLSFQVKRKFDTWELKMDLFHTVCGDFCDLTLNNCLMTPSISPQLLARPPEIHSFRNSFGNGKYPRHWMSWNTVFFLIQRGSKWNYYILNSSVLISYVLIYVFPFVITSWDWTVKEVKRKCHKFKVNF